LSWSLQLERLVSVQGRRADRQHAYRPTLVFDDLGDRHICHVHTLVEHTFGRSEARALPALVREPDYGDAEILTSAQIAELFAVTSRTVRRWTDVGTLPSFRTIGGQRRFRWGEIRRVVA
jgi:excisionase family DNA binding protein